MNSKINTVLKKFVMANMLIIFGLLSVTYMVMDGVINTIEKSAQATIAANALKHKKDIVRLRTKHKKQIARIKAKHKKYLAKTKMKERSKRWFASIPILGTVLALWAGKEEYDDYEQWHHDNPGRTSTDYARYKKDLLYDP